MSLFFLTLAAIALAMFALALGTILTGRRLKGSCGGLAAGGADCVCERDGTGAKRCPRTKAGRASQDEPGAGQLIGSSRLSRH